MVHSKQTYQFEAKKDALRQTQDGGVKVTLSIHPQDMPSERYGDPMGQRYVCVIVPINDDETPRLTPIIPDDASLNGGKPKNYTAAAKLLAKDPKFWLFLGPHYARGVTLNEDKAEAYIEGFCLVKSCSEIKDGTEAGKKFAQLYAEFKEWESR